MENKRSTLILRAIAIVAALFGIVTVFAGSLILLDFSDPGYKVYYPLLIFNTFMGFVYVGSGVMIWRDLKRGESASKTVFLLNFLVFVLILFLYLTNGNVVLNSVIAMAFRTMVWLIIFAILKKL